jgi:hypothetical protein
MNRWYMRRFRPHAFNPDQKGTCRYCGKPAYFVFDTEPYATEARTRGVWLHEGETIADIDGVTGVQPDDHRASPKEFCCEAVTSSNYDECGSPVKYEDIRAENYACGRHMRKFEEDRAYRKRNEEQAARRKEQDELQAFEAEQYDLAATWIKDHGFGHLIGDYEAKPKWGRFNKATKVDVFLLKEFLEGVVEKLAATPERIFVMQQQEDDETTG